MINLTANGGSCLSAPECRSQRFPGTLSGPGVDSVRSVRVCTALLALALAHIDADADADADAGGDGGGGGGHGDGDGGALLEGHDDPTSIRFCFGAGGPDT
jgi:hypothetical protein